MDSHLVHLVRDDRDPNSVRQNQTLMLPGAANFVATTSGVVRPAAEKVCIGFPRKGFGTGSNRINEPCERWGLIHGCAVQAPWPIVRTFAAGPAISRDAALVARDALPGGGAGGAHSRFQRRSNVGG